MKHYNHELKALKFDVSFYSQELARDLQIQISKLSSDKLKAIINKVCDEEFADKDTFLQIDKLEVDLGFIPHAEVDRLLPVKLYEALKQALRHRLPVSPKPFGNESPAVSQVSENRHSEELLFVFLRYGTLPWWAANGAEHQLESIFLKLLKETPRETTAKVYATDNFEHIIRRIVYQFSDTVLVAFINALNPSYAKPLIESAAMFTKSAGLARLGIHYDKNRQWEMLLTFLNPAGAKREYDEKSLVEFVLRLLAAENNIEIETLVNYIENEAQGKKNSETKTIDKEEDVPKILQDLQPVIVELLELKILYGKLYEDIIAFIKMYDSKWAINKELDAFRRVFFNYLQKTLLPDQKAMVMVENAFRKLEFDRGVSTDSQGLRTIDNSELPKQKRVQQYLEEKKPEKQRFFERNEGRDDAYIYYIENAGLILLNPFFSTFFHRLELMQRNEFNDRHSMNRAIHLLQFLVDGQESHSENLLLLNKILCGIDINEPIEKEMVISEMEKKISLDLLNAAINNWSQLKKSSIATLRTEFLQRKGKLSFYGGEWVVRIEHNGRSDYLLNTIPWSFNMIKSSWMTEVIRVEWI